MKKIVLMNIYGSKNIGDRAICEVALRLIDRLSKNKADIYGMFVNKNEDTRIYNIKSRFHKVISPYGLAIESNKKTLSLQTKIYRFSKIISSTFIIIFLEKIGLNNKIRSNSFIQTIKQSDLVIGMGGGYIRTKNKYSDFFGLILTLLPIYIAKFYKKPILFLPMSFGNFASNIHRKIALNAVSGTTLMIRDKPSLLELRRSYKFEKNIKLNFIPDLALFYKNKRLSIHKRPDKNSYIVLTARKWLKTNEQFIFEKNLLKFIKEIWTNYNLKTFFVSMANNSIEDNDKEIGQNFEKQIINKNIFENSLAANPKEVQELLKYSKVAICTRMHSAILSFTVNTPFIAIGYESKTKGLMNFFDLKDWYIDINKVTCNKLLTKFNKLLNPKEYKIFCNKLQTNQSEIQYYKQKLNTDLKLFLN